MNRFSVHATTRDSDEQHALKSANNVTWTLYISQVNIWNVALKYIYQPQHWAEAMCTTPVTAPMFGLGSALSSWWWSWCSWMGSAPKKKKVPVDFFSPSSLSTEVQAHVLGGNSPKWDVQMKVWRQCMTLDAFGFVSACCDKQIINAFSPRWFGVWAIKLDAMYVIHLLACLQPS